MQHRICKTPKLRTPQVFNSPSQWARGADRIPSLQREAGPAAQRGRSPGLDRGHWWLWIPPGAPGGQRSGVCAPWWQLLWHAEEPHRAQALRACRELLGIITWTCSRWARGNWKFDFFFFRLILCLVSARGWLQQLRKEVVMSQLKALVLFVNFRANLCCHSL